MVGRLVYLECVFFEAGEARVAFQCFGGAGVLLLHPDHGTRGRDIFEPLVFVGLFEGRKCGWVRGRGRGVAAGGPADQSQYSYDPEGEGAESHSLSSKKRWF